MNKEELLAFLDQAGITAMANIGHALQARHKLGHSEHHIEKVKDIANEQAALFYDMVKNGTVSDLHGFVEPLALDIIDSDKRATEAKAAKNKGAELEEANCRLALTMLAEVMKIGSLVSLKMAELKSQANAQQMSPASHKPTILCDVGGTLLVDDMDPNQELITLLNQQMKNGFEVRLCTGSIDTGTWVSDRFKLAGAHLDPGILQTAQGKAAITQNTYSDVVAVVDNSPEHYLEEVRKGNPNARHFRPDQIPELLRYLQGIKRDFARAS